MLHGESPTVLCKPCTDTLATGLAAYGEEPLSDTEDQPAILANSSESKVDVRVFIADS
jgi:hypothetical protein